jgi:hypothetical protein
LGQAAINYPAFWHQLPNEWLPAIPDVPFWLQQAEPKVRAHYEKVGKKAGSQPFRVAVSDFYAGRICLKANRGFQMGNSKRVK